MALTITSAPSGELLELAEAKQHLRLFDSSMDDEVARMIREARDICERETGRTLRTAVTRVLTADRWWSWRGWPAMLVETLPALTSRWALRRGLLTPFDQPYGGIRLPFPPLIAVTGITYYDTDNAQQTLASSNYVVQASTNDHGRVAWAANANIPAVYNRPDAITMTFTTGYATADDVPPAIMRAWKIKLTELWGAGTPNEMQAAADAFNRVIANVDATSYA